MPKTHISFFILAILVWPSLGLARTVYNEAFHLDIPKNWICFRTQNDWSCQSETTAENPEAQIVIRTKPSKKETLEDLLPLLSNPIVKVDARNKILVSKPYYAKISSTRIGQTPYLESLHFESEKRNYFTEHIEIIGTLLRTSIKLNCYKDKFPDCSAIFNDIKQSISPSRGPILSGPNSVPYWDLKFKKPVDGAIP